MILLILYEFWANIKIYLKFFYKNCHDKILSLVNMIYYRYIQQEDMVGMNVNNQ